MKLLLLLPLCLVSCNFAISGSSYERVDLSTLELDTVSRSVSIDASVPIQLHNLAGEIEIVRGDQPQIIVEAEVYSDSLDLLNGMNWGTHEVEEGQQVWSLDYPLQQHTEYSYPVDGSMTTNGSYLGERVTLTSKKGSRPTLFADLLIRVPDGAQVKVVSILGNTEVRRVRAALSVRNGSGGVNVEGAGSDGADSAVHALELSAGSGLLKVVGGKYSTVVARTGSGNIDLTRVHLEEASLETGSGNLGVTECSASSFRGSTGSGNIEIGNCHLTNQVLSTGSGNVVLAGDMSDAAKLKARTGSGNIRIEAGPNTEFTLSAEQGSGNLRCGYSDAEMQRSGNRLVGARRGSGTTQIELSTGSGNCSVEP